MQCILNVGVGISRNMIKLLFSEYWG